MIPTAVSTNLSVLGSADMEMMVWNIILTAVVGIMMFLIKGKFDDLARISILLNRTREEIARDHVTRAEMNGIVDKLGERFDRSFERLESKLDEMRKV
jgi:low affinity Fe/Cu permease